MEKVMKGLGFVRTPLAALAVGLAVHAFVPACRVAEAKQVPPEQQKRFEAMQAKGAQASLTVFPVVMGGRAFKDVANVLALLLEKEGMKKLQATDAVFRAPKEATLDEAAELFAAFIRENPIETEYALYGEFVGTPETGPKEIRGVIVDRAGKRVLVDRWTATDREFKRARPGDPMTCSLFLAERVRARLGLPASARDDSGEGRFARLLRKSSTVPDKAERAAMEQRQAAMKKAGQSARVAVFPVRLSNDEVGSKAATHLAGLLSKKKLCMPS